MTATDIASTELADRQYAHAIDLVQRFRAASVALMQRHLAVETHVAEALLLRMSQETNIVRRMPDGLYMFIGEVIREELRALHGFAQEVLAAIETNEVDIARLRTAATRFGIADTVDARRSPAT